MYKDPRKEEAYRRWKVIRYRCNNPNAMHYRYYGGKGIKMEIPSKDFIDWYLANKPADTSQKWTIGRIDHTKNYTLDNIEFLTASDNIKERNARAGLPKRNGLAVEVYARKTGEYLHTFESQEDAASFLKISIATVSTLLSGVNSGKLHPYILKREVD